MKKGKWIYFRDGQARGIFNSRKEAVIYFKELLKQTLKDFDKQDKTDEYDYPIEIVRQEIKPLDERDADLSLL